MDSEKVVRRRIRPGAGCAPIPGMISQQFNILFSELTSSGNPEYQIQVTIALEV